MQVHQGNLVFRTTVALIIRCVFYTGLIVMLHVWHHHRAHRTNSGFVHRVLDTFVHSTAFILAW